MTEQQQQGSEERMWRSPEPDTIVIDCHNDTIVSNIRRGNLSLTGEADSRLAHREGTVSYLRGGYSAEELEWHGMVTLGSLRDGGIDAAFFAVDVTRAWKNHLAYALDALGFFLTDVELLSDRVLVARSAANIRHAKETHRLAAVLVLENSDALEGSLNILHAFHALGVRSITLTHNPGSLAACGNAESACGGGLTTFGTALVKEMNRLGMLVDVSHISEAGFWDVLKVSERAVIASHSCCAALAPHPRNLTDDQIRALAAAGGVIGLTFVPSFVDASWQPEQWPQVPSLERLVDHVDHAVEVAGIDHVGIGSDWDGGGTVLRDARDFPQIGKALSARGYSPEDVGKVMGGNVLRLLGETIG
jgi:membrane dipeptidase